MVDHQVQALTVVAVVAEPVRLVKDHRALTYLIGAAALAAMALYLLSMAQLMLVAAAAEDIILRAATIMQKAVLEAEVVAETSMVQVIQVLQALTTLAVVVEAVQQVTELVHQVEPELL
jgi:hypothetical protein